MSALRLYRERIGLTQQALADVAGTSQPQIRRLEAGERKLTKEWATRLAPHLSITAEQLLFPPEDLAEQISSPEAERSGAKPEPNAIIPAKPTVVDRTAFMGPRNVPVKGIGVGGDDGDFQFNGQIADYAPRPPGIANRRDVYVINLVGDSMSPAYRDKTPIYVDPHRRPGPGDYVVVELWGPSDDEPGAGFVKLLVRRHGGKIYLEQHNPPMELEPIAEADVKTIHRVIPWTELLGI